MTKHKLIHLDNFYPDQSDIQRAQVTLAHESPRFSAIQILNLHPYDAHERESLIHSCSQINIL